MKRRFRFSSRASWLPALLCALACTSEPTPPAPDGGGAGAGGSNTGGASTGGAALATGGASAPTGGGGSTSAGGVASGGRAGPGGGGASAGGNPASTGGATGAASGSGGTPASGGATASGGSSGSTACARTDLVWKSARKTSYTSYPDPGSEECIEYNGCTWAGQFAACNGKKPESWVEAHDIAAAFPDFDTLELHDLCLRSGAQTLVVTVLDTCGDGDCGGCCTRNQGSADQLIDLESYTNARWGVPDELIEWADLGPTKTAGCD